MHRRTSSLAVISGPQRDALRSPALAPLQEDTMSLQGITGGSTLIRRRMRAVLALLALAVFAFIALARTSLNTQTTFDPRSYLRNSPDRPYPPLTRLYNTPPPSEGAPSGRRVPNPSNNQIPSISLSPAEELGAVIAYLTSLGANAMIPSSVDPAIPIDSELVLEFNTRSERARAEVASLVAETWSQNPVVLFTESRAPASKSVKQLLDTFRLLPEPVIFDVDTRDDASVLTPLMYRLTASSSLPIVIVGGHPLGTPDEISALHKSGQLRKRLEDAGAVVNGNKKKHHK